VATSLELRKDPRTGANAIEIIAPNLATGAGITQRLGSVPQVSQTITINNLAPSDQNAKLEFIQRVARYWSIAHSRGGQAASDRSGECQAAVVNGRYLFGGRRKQPRARS
jgi:hypothetical protein